MLLKPWKAMVTVKFHGFEMMGSVWAKMLQWAISLSLSLSELFRRYFLIQTRVKRTFVILFFSPHEMVIEFQLPPRFLFVSNPV